MDKFTFAADHDTVHKTVTITLADVTLLVYRYDAYAPPSNPVETAMGIVASRLSDLLGFDDEK